MKEFSRAVRTIGDVTLVALHGELDLVTAEGLAQWLGELSGSEIVIDLAALTFVDSSGIGAIARAHQLLSESGASLVLVRPQPHVLRLLELTGLTGWVGEWNPRWSD